MFRNILTQNVSMPRFPPANVFRQAVGNLVISHCTNARVQESPKAAVLLSSSTAHAETLSHLKFWAPATLLQALQLMSRPEGRQTSVRAYALRSLHTCPPEQACHLQCFCLFFLPSARLQYCFCGCQWTSLHCRKSGSTSSPCRTSCQQVLHMHSKQS